MARKDFQRLGVLVVDGSGHMRDVLRRHLYALTIGNIREVATGKEGLRLLGEFYPDLIICDLESERVGGLELVIRMGHDRRSLVLARRRPLAAGTWLC
ncbi:MAG: response regulator [Alphaproteobacteria bacterium]|nr:response regulator [Alphaproteobacteria bacterium]